MYVVKTVCCYVFATDQIDVYSQFYKQVAKFIFILLKYYINV